MRSFIFCTFALAYGLDDRGFESRQGLGIFLFTIAPLGPTQPPIQWVPGALSLGVKRPGHEADHSPLASAWIYASTPSIRLHGVVPSFKKRRGKFTFTLPLHFVTVIKSIKMKWARHVISIRDLKIHTKFLIG
jgi:hypothetical protein